jgi:uncharacterized membrane protein YjgN (DUF898 family)
VTSSLHWLVCLCLVVIVETGVRNALARHTRFGGVSFESDLRPDSMLWLRVTNALASCLSLGLLIPWAELRTRRYYLSRLRVRAPFTAAGAAN